MTTFTLADLEAIITKRAGDDPKVSYTASLIAKGRNKVAEKMGEEAIETVIAAVSDSKSDLTEEAADLLFHFLVVLRANDIALDDVLQELARRTGQSGHAEKAARPKA
ncbi:MAG: phosphoribosyl-ATP diphosphatase [Pseudomonadota bacterium]